MLTAANALADLRRRLKDAGFDEAAPRLAVFWPVFQAWIVEPVEHMDPTQDSDMALFEAHLSLREPMVGEYMPSYVPPNFALSFTRQFTHHDEHGEYDHMEAHSATFRYEPTPALRETVRMTGADSGSGATLWRGGDRTAEWIAAIQATPSFQVAAEHTPKSVELAGSDV